jgi:hypothetical protein
MRHPLSTAIGFVLVIGVIGVLVTFLLYSLGFILILSGLFALLMSARSIDERRRAKRRIRDTARSVEEPTSPLAEHEFERSVAHPAWAVAVDRRRDQRQQLADWFIELAYRLRRLPSSKRGRIKQEFAIVEKLVFDAFGQRVSAVQPDIRERLRAEPPASEVLHLDREFVLTCDCRYGHWGEHLIDEAGNGRVVRRCAFCEPNTRWTERI